MRKVVKAVIYKDNKYLFQLRDNDASISYPNKWSFFGGELDEGENFEEALKRELVEELFWCPDKLFYLAKDTDKKVNCSINYYIVYCGAPENRLVLSEGQDMGWFTIKEVMDLDNICRPKIVRSLIKKAHNYINSI